MILDRPWERLDTERQVEVPWLLAHLRAQAAAHGGPIARLLDVGGTDSPYLAWLPQYAATVAVLDPRPGAFPPAGVRTLRGALGTGERLILGAPYAGVTCISVLDHVGLAAYGQPADPGQLARAVADLLRLTAPGGTLYLTVPTGRDLLTTHPGGGQRVFSRASLAALFPAAAWAWADERCWRLVDGEYVPVTVDACDAEEYAGHRAASVRALALVRMGA